MYVVILVSALSFALGRADCDYPGWFESTILVEEDAKYITSPGFPRQYPSSCKCQSSLHTELTGHVLHVEVVHMHLDNWNRSCSDSVTAYGGNGSDDEVLTRWCGTDQHSLSTSGPSLLLQFSSDETGSGFGFAISVWSALPLDTSCLENKTFSISVEKYPVHLSPQSINMMSANAPSCVYIFQAIEDGDVISITTAGWRTEANLYAIDIFDGHNTSFPKLMSWTPIHKHFTDVTSSGKHVTIVSKHDWLKGIGEAYPKVWQAESSGSVEPNTGSIRLEVAGKQESCKSAISREVTYLPTVFSLPTTLDADGEVCPLKLISRDATQTLRIDVIGDRGDNPDLIILTEGSITGKQVTRKYNTKTYRSTGPVVYVRGNSSQLVERTVRLRVITLDQCNNGKITEVTAVNSTMSDLSIEDISSNSYVVYMITADYHDNIVSLNMTSSFNGVIRSDCDQVHVDFFNGKPDHGDLIERWCPGSDFNVTVKSSMRTLYFIVNTDEADTKFTLHGSYFSMKDGSMCRMRKEDILAVPKEIGHITSPNFPGQYSINNDCVWRIAAPRINFVVVANVTWSDLPDDCSDIVYVVYGIHPSDETIGRICGNDRKSFRSSGPTLLLHFVSDSRDNRGGFRISYTSEHKSGGKKITDGPPVGIIAGACIALFVVGGVIYVIVHVYRKRQKQAKRLKESTL